MKLDNPIITQAQDQAQNAQHRLKTTLAQEQAACLHSDIAEAPYKAPGLLFDAQPPIRICLCCGITEEGWGCGFLVLHDHPKPLSWPAISRDDLYKLAQGLRITERHKGPLLRKETTVAKLCATE